MPAPSQLQLQRTVRAFFRSSNVAMDDTTWTVHGGLQLHARASTPPPPDSLPPPAPPSGEPDVNGGTGLMVLIWLLWCLTTIILIFRFVATSIVVNRLRPSDWLLVAAFVG